MDARGEKLRARLVDAHDKVMAYAQTLTHDQAGVGSSNDGWRVQDVLAHLASAELGHCSVIKALLAGQPMLSASGFDLHAFNAAEVAKRRTADLATVVAELEANHESTLALLSRIQPEQWDIAGYHPGGFDTTVEGTFRVIALHKRSHLKELADGVE